MDLEITTHTIMTDYLNSDEFLKVVEDKVKKSINDSIENALSWNNKVKKTIEEKIEDALNCSLERISLANQIDRIGLLVENVLSTQLDKQLKENLKKHLKEISTKRHKIPNKLQDIVDEFKQHIKESCSEDSDLEFNISSRVSPYSNDTIHVTLKEDITGNSVDITFWKRDGINKILSFEFQEYNERHNQNQILYKTLNSFEGYLYYIYVNNFNIELPVKIDEDYIDLRD